MTARSATTGAATSTIRPPVTIAGVAVPAGSAVSVGALGLFSRVPRRACRQLARVDTSTCAHLLAGECPVADARHAALELLSRARTDESVDAKSCVGLETPDGVLGQRSEEPVDRAGTLAQPAQLLLQVADLGRPVLRLIPGAPGERCRGE
jgi:hypothetical protein